MSDSSPIAARYLGADYLRQNLARMVGRAVVKHDDFG